MDTKKDKELWRQAKKRVSFKQHLLTYLSVNVMFWFIWYFNEDGLLGNEFPWPVWPMLGWGIGLFFSYLDAYDFSTSRAIEAEYKKLKNNL